MNSKKTILIIDDMELNREILSLILKDKYNTLEASNGEEAMKILTKEGDRISLILLDIVMPVMDGFTFLKETQSISWLNRIPIIFVTSETYKENVMEGMKMGVRDVIAKPFDPYLVCNRVDNLIQVSENREAGRSDLSLDYCQAAPDDNRRMTALIVDDVFINRQIIKAAIEEDYDILEAMNGRDALNLIKQHRADIGVVLLDIIMPIMDGVEVMEEVSKRHLLDQIPVIAITAEDSLPKINRIKELGICEVIHKPFDSVIVKNRINYLVELHHRRPARSV